MIIKTRESCRNRGVDLKDVGEGKQEICTLKTKFIAYILNWYNKIRKHTLSNPSKPQLNQTNQSVAIDDKVTNNNG